MVNTLYLASDECREQYVERGVCVWACPRVCMDDFQEPLWWCHAVQGGLLPTHVLWLQVPGFVKCFCAHAHTDPQINVKLSLFSVTHININALKCTYSTSTHILSTEQGSGSIPVHQWFNLALTSTADQDGAWQQFPSDEYLCNRWCRHEGQSSATIHCVISEQFGVLRSLVIHVKTHTCTKTVVTYMQIPL